MWSFGDTDAYTVENCDWCSTDSIGHVYFLASQFIKDRFAIFYGEFSEVV